MAEDNNEDLSMEDILSSIKNILTEGDASTSSAEPVLEIPEVEAPVANIAATDSEPVATVADAVVVTTDEENDDILDLSPDMRVEDIIAATPDINLDEELDNVAPSVSDITEIEPTIGIPDDNSDPFDTLEDSNVRLTDIVTDVLPQTEPASVAETVSEPLPLQEQESIVVAEEISAVVNDDVAVAEEIASDVQPVVTEEKKEGANAIDASASIISNFAKMFAKEEKPAPQAPVIETPAEPVKELGNTSRTLEDMIHEVIRNVIGAEVAENWKNGLDYNQFAKEEISRQTRLWLEANLPAIVEHAVKEEIERVMAKVGTYQ